MPDIKIRLQHLRQTFSNLGADAFYCELSDAHLSEYIQKADQFLTYLTGFTGSNAQLAVTADRALLWTDSRYWEQAQNQLKGTGIELMRQGEKDVATVSDWLKQNAQNRSFVVATPLETLPLSGFQKIEEVVSKVVDFPEALIAREWSDRPDRTVHSLYIHKASSVTGAQKLKRLRDYMSGLSIESDKASLLLTKLDDIAWLTNLRGSDIDFNPVFFSWALVRLKSALLFVHEEALTEEIRVHLKEAGWCVLPYEQFDQKLTEHIAQGAKILARANDLNAKLYRRIEKTWLECKHPVAYWKAIKTPEEVAGLKEVMKADGKALEAFISELRDRLSRGEKLTENDAVALLHEKRSAIPGFIGESFGTIAAVDANAALPHYEPIEGQGAPIVPPCVLLVDSGAHYDKGTTDTTRVWFLGNPADYPEENFKRLQRDYTAVYQAMKALSEAVFKPGTTGVDLDRIARVPIHAIGADFGHGTGHGIGLTLNVHETPPTITPRSHEGSMTPFEPGMITSDEPGIYRPGEWGIRLENMLLCVQKAEGLLGFETLTECEIDKTLLG